MCGVKVGKRSFCCNFRMSCSPITGRVAASFIVFLGSSVLFGYKMFLFTKHKIIFTVYGNSAEIDSSRS